MYAPSAGSSSTPRCSARTQSGPVRTPESVHRIDDLEPGQIYVVWIRVLCDQEEKESKQLGFKTLPARPKSIWDEPDHVILGVERMATVKQITRAWRQRSLQCHPDKETDPDKKEAAEDMMKRLNLAKANMLMCAPLDDDMPTPSGDAPAPSSSAPPARSRCQCPMNDWSDSDDENLGWSAAHARGDDDEEGPRPRSPDAEGLDDDGVREAAEQGETLEDGCLPCLMRVDASRPPKLKFLSRGPTSLRMEASELSSRYLLEVQMLVDGEWTAALPPWVPDKATWEFELTDLEENREYRLRLRAVMELEPLRLLFAGFVIPETDALDDTPQASED